MNPQKKLNLSIINLVTAVALIGFFATSITNRNHFVITVIAFIVGLIFSVKTIRNWNKYCDLTGRKTRFNYTVIFGFATIVISFMLVSAVVYCIIRGEVSYIIALSMSTVLWINLSRIVFKNVIISNW
jgi:flagellar biosynthesis protein FlhB